VPHHLGVPSGASKMISEPMVCLVQTLQLSSTETYTVSKWTEQDSTIPTSPKSSIRCAQNNLWAYGLFGANPAPILHRHWHYLQTDQNEIPQDPHHLRVLSGASKRISEPMTRSVQTVHWPCVKISTIFKQPKSSFHLSLIILNQN
jgi:hypothetical protein